MVIVDNAVKELTEVELLDMYLKHEIDCIMGFNEYKEKVKRLGVKVIEIKG